jgi:hypothetical protein
MIKYRLITYLALASSINKATAALRTASATKAMPAVQTANAGFTMTNNAHIAFVVFAGAAAMI